MGTHGKVPSISNKWPLFIYNKLNKLQIKLLWVFLNYNKVLGSIKNKKFLNLSDPLTIFYVNDFPLLTQWGKFLNTALNFVQKCPHFMVGPF